MIRFFICANCNKEFESRYAGKKFCTLKCYHDSPEFRARMQSYNERIRTRKPFECLNCKGEVLPGRGRGKKYCSQKCYREYMAGRFDRYIGSPESLALPQNYDEFLTGEELRCLIDGCGWSGICLSQHMNFAHGIKKDEFKEMAGFNKSTGVVTADHSAKLSAAKGAEEGRTELMRRLRAMQDGRGPAVPVNRERRLEEREHYAKARDLRVFTDRDLICPECGTSFTTQSSVKRYCSVKCRDLQRAWRRADRGVMAGPELLTACDSKD